MATVSSSFTTPELASISSAGAGLVTISTDHGWQVGDVVRFQGLTEMTQLNGTDQIIITVPNTTTFTIGDTSNYNLESTGGPDTCFLVLDVSGYLRTGVKGEDVTVALSGTYTTTMHLERSITPDETAWEKVLPSGNGVWDTANATVSEVYQTQADNETLRLVVTDLTPTGTVVASLTDSAKVIQSFVDDDGNELFELTEDGIVHRGTLTVDGVSTLTGVVTATGGITGDLTGNVTGDLTGAASTVTAADESTDTSSFPLFVTAATGDLSVKTGANLTFNSNTGALVSTNYDGIIGANSAAAVTATSVTSSSLSVTSSGVGAASVGTVTAVENGIDPFHQTVLTCTNTLITMADESGVGQYGGTKIYDFPSGALVILGCVADGDFTAVEPWLDTWAGDMGLGTTAPTDAAGSAAGEANIQQLTATETASTLVAAINSSFQVATVLNESGARWINGTDTDVDLYLNMITDDHVDNTNTTDAMKFTGTITITWINLGTIAA